jgi:hypothetical protein
VFYTQLLWYTLVNGNRIFGHGVTVSFSKSRFLKFRPRRPRSRTEP